MHFAASDVNDGKRPFTAVAKNLEDCPELDIQPRALSDALFDLVAPAPAGESAFWGMRQKASTASAMRALALPAPTTTSCASARGGMCAGTTRIGSATSTARRNRSTKNALGSETLAVMTKPPVR